MKIKNKLILATIWILSTWWLAIGSGVFLYNWNWNQQIQKNYDECSNYLNWEIDIATYIEEWLKLMREEEKLARDVYLTLFSC